MNIFIGILLIFALLGLFDKLFGGKLGLAAEFDSGLESMASLALSIVGVYCIGVTAVKSNPEAIAAFAAHLPFDASILIGSLLAPDMGGYAIAKEMAATPALGIFSGVMVASSLGATISFTLPVALTTIRKEDTAPFMQGIVWGIVTIPAGVVAGALAHRPARWGILSATFCPSSFCARHLPLPPQGQGRHHLGAVALGNLVRIASLLLFALVMLGVFLPSYQIVSDDLFFESLTIVIKIAGGGGWVDGGRFPHPAVFLQRHRPHRRPAGHQRLFGGGADRQPGHLYLHDPHAG